MTSEKRISKGLEYMPAGWNPVNMSGLAAYVRYRRGPDEIRLLDKSSDHYHIRAPDRELFLVRNFHEQGAFRPDGSDWDEVLHLSTSCAMASDYDLKYLLMNRVTFLDKEHTSPRTRMAGHRSPDNLTICADCFVGNTPIVTDRGIITMRELSGPVAGKTRYLGNTGIVTNRGQINVPRKRFRSEKRAHVYRVELANGQHLTCSKGQMFMTDKGWKEAHLLDENDVIHARFGDDVWSQNNVKFDYTVDTYLNRRFNTYPDEIPCPCCNKSFQQIDSHLSAAHGICVSTLDLPYTKSKAVAMKHSRKKIKQVLTFPTEMTVELAELLGYIVADGRLRYDDTNASVTLNFGVKEDLVERVVELYAQVFSGIALHQVIDPNLGGRYIGAGVQPSADTLYHEVTLDGGSIFMEFLSLIGCPAVKSNKKSIPWSVLQSRRECVQAFLVGLFGADGSISKNGSPSLYTSSRRMARELPVVLNNLGILTCLNHLDRITYPATRTLPERTEKGYGCKISVSGRDSNNLFHRLIPLVMSDKAERQYQREVNAQVRGHAEGKGVSYSNKRRTKGLLATKVVSVKKTTERRTTYDITVSTEDHAFLVGPGIVAHNSGGFQLATQRIDYLDPIELARWYNDNVDIGMALDIPTFRNDLRDRGSRVLANNNNIMLEHLRPDLRLMNIIHGDPMDINSFYRCLDIVHNEKMRGLSIAGLYFGTVVEAVSKMVRIMEYIEAKYPGHYDHIHILGIFNIRVLLPLLYLMNHRYPHIQFTSDSTTYLKYSLNNIYLSQSSLIRAVMAHPIGYAEYPEYKTSTQHRTLTCSCPVCRTLKYTDIFTYNRGFINYFLMWHNALELTRYIRMMNQLSRDLEYSDYRKLSIQHIRNNRKDDQEAKSSFDFVEEFLTHDINRAMRKYAHWISRPGMLFGDSKGPIIADEAGETPEVVEDYSYQDAVLKRYEDDQSAERVRSKKLKPSKINKMIMNKSVSRRKQSLSRRKPVDKKKKRGSHGKTA